MIATGHPNLREYESIMPIALAVDQRCLLIRMQLSGTLTVDEMVAAVDTAFPPGETRRFNVFSDHRGLIDPVTTEQLQALVSHLVRRRTAVGGMRWAIVVGQPASYGMMRMLGVLAEQIPITVEVFNDPAEAARWLDLRSADA